MRIKQAPFWKTTFGVPCLVNAVILGTVFFLKIVFARFHGPEVFGAGFNYSIIMLNVFAAVALSAFIYKLLGFIPLKELADLIPYVNKFVKTPP